MNRRVVRFESYLGSQISKPQVGFELNFGTREASPHPFGAAMLKQARELFHRKPGLSDQRSKSPFGQFFKLQLYNHAQTINSASARVTSAKMRIDAAPELRSALGKSKPEAEISSRS